MSSSNAQSSFQQFHEPSNNDLLILSGFLVLLPTASFLCKYTIYAPPLGPLVLGVLFGTPVSQWLPVEVQQALGSLGYCGLLLMILHGGLSSDLVLAKRSILLSLVVAATGIALPIGFSIPLLSYGFGFTTIQGFTAGAALASTSLGTTFALLRAATLDQTRLGAVLTNAAMADDVVSLVLLRVVENLSEGHQNPWSDARPIVVAIVLLGVSWLLSRFVILPLAGRVLPKVPLRARHAVNLFICAALAFGYVSAAGYAGTSVLLGAFVAGLVGSAIDAQPGTAVEAPSLGETYAMYIEPLQESLLVPFFFASIGFSIPVREMFKGPIIWKGIVYSILMTFGKLLCGVWTLVGARQRKSTSAKADDAAPGSPVSATPEADAQADEQAVPQADAPAPAAKPATKDDRTSLPSPPSSRRASPSPPETRVQSPPSPSESPKSNSNLTPFLILGLAMVARGEIGLLISQVSLSSSQSSQVQEQTMPLELFLITTWAIVLCTIVGPVGVGLVLRWRRGLEGVPAEWR